MGDFADGFDGPRSTRAATAGGPLVELRWQQTRAGPIELRPSALHRIRLHSGAPVRGACSAVAFTYTAGDLDLLPAGHAEGWQEYDDSRSLWLSLSARLLQRAAEDLDLDPARAHPDLKYQFRDPHIEHIAWALEAEQHDGGARSGDHDRLYAESLGYALAVHLLRRHARPLTGDAGLPPARLRRLESYIDTHLDRELSLPALADVAGVSVSHLKTLFRRSTGLPVHQYVLRRRVERARLLLERGELPLSQIALEAGFAHQSHMARCMRRLLGTTPAALRRSQQR